MEGETVLHFDYRATHTRGVDESTLIPDDGGLVGARMKSKCNRWAPRRVRSRIGKYEPQCFPARDHMYDVRVTPRAEVLRGLTKRFCERRKLDLLLPTALQRIPKPPIVQSAV